MKQKFFARIGQWTTPPCIRKCSTSLKTLTLLLVMGLSVNVWGADETVMFPFTNKDQLQGWTSNPAPGSCETADPSRGLAWSKAAITSFSYTLSDYGVSKVSIVASANATGYTLFVNGGTGQTVTKSNNATYNFDVDVAKGGTITISTTKGDDVKSFWIKSITLTKASGDDPSGPTLESIYFTDDAATKLSYTEGDVFDPAGLVVMGKYSEGEDKAVTADVEWSFNPETLAATTTSVTVTASIDGVEDASKTVSGITVASAPKFTKVTANKTDWSGEYLLVYENNSTAYVWTGVDVANCNATATISNNQITKPADAVSLTIASMDGGYSILVNGGTNDGKYIYGTSGSNKINFGTTASLNTITYPYADGNNSVKIVSNSATMRYNNASNNNRFRYFGSAGQQNVQLYEKVLAPTNEAVTFTAPEGGSLVIKNGATPIATGATIQNGTVLDVTFGMTPAEAYKDVAIKVTKTVGGDDVTSAVYNSETKKITMPRYAITVAVTSTKLYKIEAATVTGGSFSWEDENKTKPTYVEVGTYIQALQEETTHYEFKSFDIYKTGDNSTKVEDADGLFEMPAYDVTISGTFEEMQCTALPSAPELGTPTISYADGVTLNWSKLDAASGYLINVWKGSEKILDDEVIEGVDIVSYKIGEEMEVNTTYNYSIAGFGDDETYCMLGNPESQSTFTTADYPAVVLTLSENSEETPVNGKLNTPITLPTESTQACEGKVFVGWSENPIEGEVGKDQVTLLGETYTFTNPAVLAKTIYAVYAKETPGENQKYTLDYTTDVSSKTLGYGSAVEVTASDGSKWVVKASKQQGMQINTGKNASIKIPTCPRNITSIEVVGTAEKAVGLSAEDYTGSGTITYIAFGTDAKEQTIDLTNKSVTSGYIVGKSGANPITKIVVNYEGESTYSNYCTTCVAAVAAPTFGLPEGNYNVAQTLTLTATEGDIYYTINDGAETLYTAAIELDKRGTYEISAYAKVEERTSETVTKTYTLDWAYTLEELVDEGAPTTTGRTVTVILTDEVIESFAISGSYVNGFFTMVGDKKIEVYCKNSPSEWEVGGKVSGTVTCTWKLYSSTWELCPENWNWVTNYTPPAKITSLVIDGDVNNKNYTAGQKLDFTGLKVTGVYNDNTEQKPHTEDVTDDVVWTEVTLTENKTDATAEATLNNVKTGNQDVKATKPISGLTVGAAVTLESIYVDTEHSTHKTKFFVGRPFSAEGLKVMAHYNMGEDQPIAVANLDITNTTFSEAEAEHAINISYTENGVEKTTSYNVEVKYMNLNDLVAEDVPTNTSVKVVFSDVEITGFYTNKSEQRTGVYVNVNGKNGANIELYSGGTPSATLNDWQEGGLISSKGDYITGTWKYYDGGSVWEIDFSTNYAWSTNIEYTAPVIYPTKIELNKTAETVKQSKSLDLEAIFTPANVTVLNNLEWSSDNTDVTVAPSQDKKSAIVTVAPDATVGTATITVKVDDKDGNELSATCFITIQEYSVPRYGLYYGELTEGDYLITYNYNGLGAMNTTITSNRAGITSVTPINNIIASEDEDIVWHIAKSGDNWTLYNAEANKYAAGNGTNNQIVLVAAATADAAKWTVTIKEEDTYEFVNVGNSASSKNANLRRNTSNGFACYSASLANSGALTLYKADFTPAPALTSIEIQGTLTSKCFQGKSVRYNGLSVLGHYSNNTDAPITEGITWSADPATFNELGEQTVTITATVQTKSGEVTDDAEFDVTVVAPVVADYELVEDVNDLNDGAAIILGAVFGTEAKPIYAVNQGFNSKCLDAYRSNDEGSDLEYANKTMKTANASEITLKKVESGWKLMDENGKYINGAADLSQTDNADEATVWTISIEDGVAEIASGSNIIYYNTSSPRFKTYTNPQQEIGIYMKPFVTVRENLTVGSYGTVCWPKDVVSYTGATFYQVDNKDEAANEMYFNKVDDGEKLNAGQAYLFQATDATIQFKEGANEVVEPISGEAARGFYGVFERATCSTDREWYGIYGTKIQPMAAGAGVPANRAYIKLDEVPTESYVEAGAPAPRRLAMVMPKSTATDLYLIYNPEEGARKMMMNNQIIIIREGRHYNVHGQMLK